jgi:hypothetical protein
MPKYGSRTYVQIHIKGFNYISGGGAWEVIVGGYNYSDHVWYHPSVTFIGRVPFTEVRLGNNGTKDILLLGNLTTVWTNETIGITEIIASSANIDGWETGWTSGLITSEVGLNIAATVIPDILIDSSGVVKMSSTIKTASSVPWDLGPLTVGSAGNSVDATRYVTVTIGGIAVRLAVLA